MSAMEAWLPSIAAAFLTVVFALVLMPLARNFGWMDRPAGRKAHAGPTPLVGGVAIFLSCTLVVFTSRLPFDNYLLLACSIVLVSGLVDDRWPLNPVTRFGAQILACLVMVYFGGVVLNDFGSLFWDRVLNLGPFSVPVTVFAALGVINAFNMIDGMDGESGSVFLVCCLGMAVLAARTGQFDAVMLLMIAAGAVLGFLALNARLPWNQRGRIFLGDSGSLLLGFFLAWMFIDLGNGDNRAFAPMTAVWIFGIPLLDTTRLIRRRWREGGSAFAADRFHLHDAFLRARFTTGQTWLFMTLLCILSALVGVLSEIYAVPEYLRFYGFIVFGLVYLAIMRRTWRTRKFLGRLIHDL